MKTGIAKVAMSIASLSVSAAARADCTTNPFQMGWDAANQACEDIAQGWVPEPWEASAESRIGEPGATPERTCTSTDVIQCKNAMAQYLRSSAGAGCADLIRRNVTLKDPVTGSPSGTADQTWRNYVTTTCNL
jgi:hypothetical protein